MAQAIQLDLFGDHLKTSGAEFARRLTVALSELALEMEAGAKRNATGSPAVRTGRLRRSIRATVEDGSTGPEIHLQAGGEPRISYARLQEYGGTVRPTAGDWLRIPLSSALTASGVDRFSGSLRVLAPDEFYARRAPSGLYLFRRDEPDGAPWYKLVRETEVKGSRYLGRALDAALGSLQIRMADIWRVSLGGV